MCIVGGTFSHECQTFLDNFETSLLTISSDQFKKISEYIRILYYLLAGSFIYLLKASAAFKKCH